MVEVFKTNIHDRAIAYKVREDLLERFPDFSVNFDLDDCDKILRIECEKIVPEEVTGVLNRKGFLCEVLE